MKIMRSLRSRLTMAFVLVVVVVGFLPVMAGIGPRMLGLTPWDQTPAVLADLPPEAIAQLQQTLSRAMVSQLLQYSLTTAVVAILAGILVTRNLTRPLSRLVAAARAIGARDLSHRVEVKDKEAEEFVAVAAAFNEMAHDLENAEALRRNLLADVAHELRTPLSVLQGNLQAMLDGVYPINAEEVARLHDQTRHLTQLVDDLRELAQAEARQLQLDLAEVDPVPLFKQAGAVFRPIATAARVELRVELLGAVPHIVADRDRLTQSLHNLLNNAINHTPAGGQITMQLEAVGVTVQIRVCDTGAGIAPAHLPHVFDRFYRTDKARARDKGGTGLGLAIVNAIAQAHGGSVVVESEGLGKGSTFTMQLPLEREG